MKITLSYNSVSIAFSHEAINVVYDEALPIHELQFFTCKLTCCQCEFFTKIADSVRFFTIKDIVFSLEPIKIALTGEFHQLARNNLSAHNLFGIFSVFAWNSAHLTSELIKSLSSPPPNLSLIEDFSVRPHSFSNATR